MNLLAEILSSKIRAEIFRLLVGTIAEELHMREIEGLSESAIELIHGRLGQLDILYSESAIG